MRKGGGIVSLIAGLLATLMAFVTLGVGGTGVLLGSTDAATVMGLGWAGLFLSFAIIALAVIAMYSKSVIPGILIIIVSAINVFAGGTLVATVMVLGLIGGAMVLVGVKQELTRSRKERVQ